MAAGSGSPRTPSGAPGGGVPATLIAEHRALWEQAAARGDQVLSAAAQGRWPQAELERLLGYLRSEMLRQATAEEWRLFPELEATAELDRLVRDHVRLRAAVDRLEQAAGGQETRSPASVAVVVRDVLAVLKDHLGAEEQLLAAAAGARGLSPGAVAAVCAHSHAWYPLTEGSVVDVDALPADQAVQACVDRVLRLGRDEQIELSSSRDPRQVWQRVHRLDPEGYGFEFLENGPERWRVKVTRRSES